MKAPNPRPSARTASRTASSQTEKLPLNLFRQLRDESGGPSIKRVLIANRGEIACRVIHTCKKLNLTGIVVFTDPYVTAVNGIHV